ncbi:hypothetical protein PAXRUDRAFT_833880, partial [Paxillus rubicundulus Ve08.2h10]
MDPVASNITPPSRKQTRRVENGSTASKTDTPTFTHAFFTLPAQFSPHSLV